MKNSSGPAIKNLFICDWIDDDLSCLAIRECTFNVQYNAGRQGLTNNLKQWTFFKSILGLSRETRKFTDLKNEPRWWNSTYLWRWGCARPAAIRRRSRLRRCCWRRRGRLRNRRRRRPRPKRSRRRLRRNRRPVTAPRRRRTTDRRRRPPSARRRWPSSPLGRSNHRRRLRLFCLFVCFFAATIGFDLVSSVGTSRHGFFTSFTC